MGLPQIVWLVLTGIGMGAAVMCHGRSVKVSAWHSLVRIAGAAALLAWGGFFDTAQAADQVPRAAEQYRRTLVRSAHAHWGLDAPIATIAGQVHQESAWRADARSAVGAQGLAQFMPATSDWIAGLYPDSLGPAQPYSPGWALRAMVTYDRWLYARVNAANGCERWAMTLSAYNGGLGWVQRDQRWAQAAGADPSVWFGSVEQYNAGRSAANFRENRGYPRNILRRWEVLYASAGWGSGACREGSA